MSEGLSFHYHQYGSLSRPHEAQRNGKKLLADLVQLATVALCLSAALTWGGQQPPLRQLNGSWTTEPCQNPTPRGPIDRSWPVPLLLSCSLLVAYELVQTRQTRRRVTACIFAETSAPVAFALQCLGLCFDIKKGSIMVHMDGFNQNEPQHVQTMQRALERLSRRFPTAGLVLQLGDKFYEHRDGELREVPWMGPTPPPVVTRMSAINLPRHGRCVLVEGQHLHIAVASTQQPGLPALASAEIQAAHAVIAAEGAELRPVPDPPLVLYCIQANVLQAEKLRPMFSTPDGRKALFAAPMRPLPAEGTVTLRLRRGHAFSPDVTMTTTWLQEKRHVAASAHTDMRTSESPAAVTKKLGEMKLDQ